MVDTTAARFLPLAPASRLSSFCPPQHRRRTARPCLRLRCSVQANAAARDRLANLVDEFRGLPEPVERVKRLLSYADGLAPIPEIYRTAANRVMGCTAQVWAAAELDMLDNRMKFAADSDSEITRGFCACLISVLDGSSPDEVLELRPEDFQDLNVVGLPGRTSSRANTWHTVLITMQKKTRALVVKGEARPPPKPFPSVGGQHRWD